MRYSIFSFVVLLLFASCEPVASFEEPQPTGINSLDEIPGELHGSYLNEADSSVISIDKSCITRKGRFIVQIPKEARREDVTIKGDTLIHKDGSKEKVTIINDTIHILIPFQDTIFRLSATELIKKFKGEYYLNYEYGISWIVRKLELIDDVLVLASIEDEGIKKMQEITGQPDSTRFNPSKRDFRKFIRNHGFSEDDRYIKINSANFDSNGQPDICRH